MPHLCLRAASRLWSWEALRRSEVEEDCSEDMVVVVVVVVRVWLLLLTMMTMTTVPIGDLGNSDLRCWEVDYGWTLLFDRGWCWGSQVGKRESWFG